MGQETTNVKKRRFFTESYPQTKILNQPLYGRYEKLYETLLNAIPSSVLMIDRDMRIISANRNFLEKSRRSIADTINHRLEDVFPAIILDHIDLTRQINRVFENNQPIKGQRLTYRAPGVPIRIYYYSILPFSWDQVVESAMLLMEDVTEQVRLSEEVRRAERHLASIVESASDIILSTDTEAVVLTWNTAAEKLTGYAFHEVEKHLFFEYCPEDYQKEIKRVFSRLKASKISKNAEVAEWDLMTKHGGRIPISWVFSPMKDELSQTVGIVGMGRDLTERRKFEMQLLQSQKLAALGVMAGGIAHEIRNPLAVCSSAAQFLLEGGEQQEFQKECAEKINTGIQRASNIIENLLRFAKPSAKTDMTQVNLLSILEETILLVANQAKIQKIEVITQFPQETIWITAVASLLQQVFMNLFLNAIDAMPSGGFLNIGLERKEEEVLIQISDSGRGIDRKTIANIFDPFYTTSPVGKGTGLGLSICYSIVKQHFGTIEVDSVVGKGSTFTVRLPIF